MDPLLQSNLAGLPLRNPVILAAGTAGLLDELGGRSGPLSLSHVGGVVTKSITRESREGNNTWRLIEHRAGMLNAIGLANPGLASFLEHTAPRAASVPATVIASVAGFSVDDYVTVAACIDQWAEPGYSTVSRPGAPPAAPDAPPRGSIPAIELNVSCPNVRSGLEFGMAPALLRELLAAVRPVVRHARLVVKLSPATPDIVLVARAAIDAGVDALTIGNTMPAMAIDVETRKPRLSNTTGGLSGPGIHPIALKLVHDVYRKVARDAHGPGKGVPIIGAGGVLRWEDAAEFILAGATAVQMGTALFVDPRSPIAVARGLRAWVSRQGCANISELVGALRLD